MRRVARHLRVDLDKPLQGLPADDDELVRTVTDLDVRAPRDREIGPNELEHGRLLLELARLNRLIDLVPLRGAGEAGPSVTELSRARQAVRTELSEVTSRLERPV
jgi:hypothetical protein